MSPLPSRLKAIARDTPLAWDWLVRHLIRQSLEAHAGSIRGRLLDIGARDRPYRSLFANVTSYVAVDLSRSTRPDVNADALHLPFRDASFDGVLCAQVLDDVFEPGALLAEIRRVLKPGGRALVSAPQVWGPHDLPHDYWRFTREGLRRLAAGAGLEVVAIEANGGLWPMVMQRAASWIWHRTPAPVRPGTVPLIAGMQLAGLAIDRVDPGESDTLNFVLVASRP